MKKSGVINNRFWAGFYVTHLISMNLSPFESRNFQIVFPVAFFVRSAKSLIFDGKKHMK
jgi:hypothetical protein